MQGFTYSATAVHALLRASMGGGDVPPRLLRATQATAFRVYRLLPKDGSSLSTSPRDKGLLPTFVRDDLWGHVTPEECETFVEVMCRAKVLSVSPNPAYRGYVDISLSPHTLRRGRIPRFQTPISTWGTTALFATLYEVLDPLGVDVPLTKTRLCKTSGLSRSALKRGLARLEAAGVIVRRSQDNQMHLAWGPSALKGSWRGIKRFQLKLAGDGRSISVDARLRVRLPGGGVTFLPEGCRIEVPEQTVDEFEIDMTAGDRMAPVAPIE